MPQFLTSPKVPDATVASAAASFKQVPREDHMAGKWMPVGCVRDTCDIRQTIAAGMTVTSGQPTLQLIYLEAGDVVSSISFLSGSTSGATLTHCWAALLSSSLVVQAKSADNTTATWASNSIRTFAMTAPYTVPTSGWYYLELTVVGTTMPTLTGNSSVGSVGMQLVTGLGAFGKSTTTAQTAPPAVGTTRGALSIVVGWIYAYVS